MEHYGRMVRELRINKGIKQKELYQDIMSKSYAIRFEKGEHEISFFLLEKILEKLPMQVDEFLYLANGRRLSTIEWFYSEYGQRGNENDIAGLESLITEYERKEADPQLKKVRSAEVTARIQQLRYFERYGVFSKEGIDPAVLVIIKERLAAIQLWTIEDLAFFANTLDYIEYEEKLTYFRLLLPALDRYRDFERGRKVICTLLINAIHQMLLALELRGIELLLEKLLLFCGEGIEEMFFKSAYRFYSGLKLLYEGQTAQGQALAESTIRINQELGYAHQAKLFQTTFDTFLLRLADRKGV